MIGDDFTALSAALNKVKQGNWKAGKVPQLWDGRTAERIVHALVKLSGQ